MRLYLISYDLFQPGQKYAGLISDLRNAGAVQVLRSAWLMKSQASALDLCNRFTKHTDANDKVLVTEVTYESAFTQNIEAVVNPMFG